MADTREKQNRAGMTHAEALAFDARNPTPAGSMQGGTDDEMHQRYPKGSAMPTQAKEGSKWGRAMAVWRMNNPAGGGMGSPGAGTGTTKKKDDQTAQQKAASKP